MGKIIPYNDTATENPESRGARICVVTDPKEAARLHRLFARPARKPTPRMLQAIENYKRLKAMKRSDVFADES